MCGMFTISIRHGGEQLAVHILGLGCDVKLHLVNKAQFSAIEVLVVMRMTQWEFRIVSCLAGGNASAKCLKMLVMRFTDALVCFTISGAI